MRRRRSDDELSESTRGILEEALATRKNPSRELLERLDHLVAKEESFNVEDTIVLHKIIGVWKWLASFKLIFPWILAVASTLSAFFLGLSNIRAAIKGFLQ